MYLRAIHSTHHLPTLYAFLRANPLGVLTTAVPHPGQQTIQSSHIPWVLDLPGDYDPSSTEDAAQRAAVGKSLGTLRAHLSRANPHAKALIAAAKARENPAATADDPLPSGGVTLPDEILVMFTGPVAHYVTPRFYVKTKPTTGKVVPTWNYEAVQAYGLVTVYPSTTSDAATGFLHSAIEDLTRASEGGMGFDGAEGRPKEWKVDDAPDNFVHLLKKAIVGVSVEITQLGGKFKMSQEMGQEDRAGVVSGFEALGEEGMADSVARWGKAKS